LITQVIERAIQFAIEDHCARCISESLEYLTQEGDPFLRWEIAGGVVSGGCDSQIEHVGEVA